MQTVLLSESLAKRRVDFMRLEGDLSIPISMALGIRLVRSTPTEDCLSEWRSLCHAQIVHTGKSLVDPLNRELSH